MECQFSFDQADISKFFAFNPNPAGGGEIDEIDVRVKGEKDAADQQFKAFTSPSRTTPASSVRGSTVRSTA